MTNTDFRAWIVARFPPVKRTAGRGRHQMINYADAASAMGLSEDALRAKIFGDRTINQRDLRIIELMDGAQR